VAASSLEALTPFTKITIEDVMAELAVVRENGYSLVDQELEAGLRSLAVPITDARGTVVAAINVSTRSGVPVDETVAHILERLRAGAADISRDLSAAS
jgi:IclR family pca regulon transcriptional regulator